LTSAGQPAKLPRVRRSLALIAVAFASLLLAPAAQAFIYWADTENQTIGRADNDGTHVSDAFIHTGALPFQVAVDSSHIYWANQNSNSIGRANIDGSGVDNSFITGIVNPSGVAVTSGYIYWSSLEGPIGRAKIDGTAKQPELVKFAVEPCGLAVDSGHLYWVDAGSPSYIGRSGLDGSTPANHFVEIPGVSFPCGVAVNSANIFWADLGFFGGGTRIGRASISGSGPDASFIGDASSPCGIAAYGSRIYWPNGGSGAIARANSDGTGVEESFFATGAKAPCGIAIDALSTPPEPPVGPPAPPRGSINFGKLKKNLAKGTATLTVSVNGPGSLVLSGKGIRKVTKGAKGAGNASLGLKPNRGGKKSLARTGKLKVQISVTFTLAGGSAASKTKSLVLKQSVAG
jgi:hypothetical protein